MVEWNILQKIMAAFPRSFINPCGELVVHDRGNQYFTIESCENEIDVQCKVLEWLSRGAHKTSPYTTKKKNDELHEFMLNGINKYLHTQFTEEEIALVYDCLGNACNHPLTIEFVKSGYDLNLLRKSEVEE